MTWEWLRIKNVACVNQRVLSETTDPDLYFEYVDISDVSQGLIFDNVQTYTFANAPSRARRIAQAGDTAVSTVRTYLRAIASIEGAHAERVFSTGFAILHPDASKLIPKFLTYALQGNELIAEVVSRSVGVSYPAINAADLMRIKIRVPPLTDQRSITAFLDRETAKIDALIEKQTAMITLLRERRAAERCALASALDPSGERLKRKLKEVDRRAYAVLTELPLLSVSIDWGVRRRDEVAVNQAASEDTGHYKVAEVGDIVINRMRAFQGGLGVAPESGIVSPDYAVLRVATTASEEWLAEVMQSDRFVGEMTSRLRGIGTTDGSNVRTPRVSVADIGEIRLQFPDLTTQSVQLEEFRRRRERIDRAIHAVERFIELARERRSALITAAVTGQIDVREM